MTFFLMETAPARISPAPMYKCAAAFFVFHRSRDCCIPRVLHSRGTLGLDRVRSKEFFFWNSFFLLFFSSEEKRTQGPPQQHRVLSRTRRFNLLEDKPVTFLKTSCHEVCVDRLG